MYELPEGWKWVKLKEIIKTEKGKKPKNLIKEKNNNALPYLTADYFRTGILKQYSEENEKLRIVKPGDLVLIWDGSKAGDIFISDIEGILASTMVKLIIKNKEVHPKFIYFVIKHYFPILNKNTTGAGIPHVSKEVFNNLLIPIPFKDGKPDLEKQKQIVEKIEKIFNEIDKAIKLREKAINETKELFNAVLNKIFKEAEEGERWKWVKFENIVDFKMGKTPKRSEKRYWENGVYHWVSIGDMQDKYINTTKEKISEEAFREVFKGKIVPKGTLLMSFKLTIGRTAILNIDAVHNEAIISIYPKEEILRDYLYWVLQSIDYKKYINPAIKGHTLNKEILKNLLIPIPYKDNKPDIEKQKQIANYLDNLSEKIKQLEQLQEKQLNLFKELKESILNKAFEGELI
ncbi:restriction endonuclease subunit S [Methanocaldococcus fervens]|uniref:Restriction modification system DNA specificity domain protein n=1 Tax=Methanocaldococcus fervens (strain DSM 4213 / JCM 15782 / AG86) TaxID=573064 RepID=C7P6A9_METFA|nr:restriction endonuclease subunit S [Methanocaldococcus fervens]ACV24091.1 restriction modification system DNA specificity domain protein [Methanocaldococcus fervens AG86]